MSIRVTQTIKITVNEKTYNLSRDEAYQLYKGLEEIFGKEDLVVPIYPIHPVFPPNPFPAGPVCTTST